MVLHSREQFRQSAASDSVYRQFVDPVYQLLEQLIGRLLREPASAAEITRLAHAYLGQLIGFTLPDPASIAALACRAKTITTISTPRSPASSVSAAWPFMACGLRQSDGVYSNQIESISMMRPLAKPEAES